MENLIWNKYQTPLENLQLDSLPQEIQDQFYDFINNVPYIKSLTSPTRLYAKDLKRDESGKIIVDITQPHILENMDYFRPSAIHFQKYGCYTKLKPNPNPNSEFGKWIREEIRRCYEGLVRSSDGEWITGDMYFFLNYCPIQLTKKDPKNPTKTIRVVDFPKVWEGHYYVFHYLNQARNEGKHASELAARGKGKALSLTSQVLTPDGYKFWGDINVGDSLYAPDGTTTKVVAIPFEGEVNMLKITLKDGREIKCSKEHLFKGFYRGIEKVMSADFIGKNYHKKRKISAKNPTGDEYVISLPINDCVIFKEKEVPIDPYTLGLLIGDGCFRTPNCTESIRFTSISEDCKIYESLIPYKITHHKREIEHSIIIPEGVKKLKDLELFMTDSHSKFIPDIYKYNSKEVRLELLRGLVDTDGWVSENTQHYCTCSERLKDDVVELSRSLGIKTFCFKKKEAWTITFHTSEILVHLPRKAEKFKRENDSRYLKSSKRITVTKVEYVGNYNAKCVTVDREEGLFLANDFIVTHNSYIGASLLAKRFILGESKEVNKKVQCVVTASEKKYIQGANQILDMFQFYIDHCAQYTQFPRKRITSSLPNMQWIMGYVDLDSNTRKGTENAVNGITSKDDESKLRGTRGVLYLLEEMGTFPRLLSLYSVLRPSVEDGNDVWGIIFAYGTAGDSESDFAGAQELMYNPDGYRMKALPNVYDKEGQGRKKFTFFFPGYMNRAECYDDNGNSDVTKALLEILIDRYTVKYNSTDINAITKRIAEIPITPQEAILRTKGNIFPVTDLNNRLNQLDNNPREYDDVYVGNLVINGDKVEYKPSTEIPIRDFPLKDNKAEGAIEIFKMPEKNAEGKVFPERYIIGVDPVDDDSANTMSLFSIFVLDLWSDQIVAEYTGRKMMADEHYEIVRKLCLFYNAKCLYESNKKGIFAYFQRMHCLYLLADTPEYLKDKDLIKFIGQGNKSKGVNASLPINNYANILIRDWLLKPIPIIEEVDGEEVETTSFNLYKIRNRALIKELILFNPDINVDRIRALGMVMLYREEKMIMYQGDLRKSSNTAVSSDYLGNDPFFNNNYDNKFGMN